MGYMGFGMRKEAYSRAPRRYMAYLKPWLKASQRPAKETEGRTKSESGDSRHPVQATNPPPRLVTWRQTATAVVALSLAIGLVWILVWLMTAALALPNRAPGM